MALVALGVVPAFVLQPAQPVAAEEPKSSFTDVTEAMGLKGMRGGVAAWGDFDNDGWVDLCVGGEIWRNEEGKRFKKVAQVSGPAIWGDYDNDDYLDLFCFDTGTHLADLIADRCYTKMSSTGCPVLTFDAGFAGSRSVSGGMPSAWYAVAPKASGVTARLASG